MQTNEPISMAVCGIVMGPVHDRQTSGVAHQLASHFNGVTDSNGTAWCDADVIDDLQSAGTALHVEGFVHRMSLRAIEEARRRGDGSEEVHFHAALITRSRRRERSRA